MKMNTEFDEKMQALKNGNRAGSGKAYFRSRFSGMPCAMQSQIRYCKHCGRIEPRGADMYVCMDQYGRRGHCEFEVKS